jgi:drug/metabolite transporter (DMT)-like permease
MIVAGIVCSASAQVMIKFASRQTFMTFGWITAMGSSAGLYGLSFVLYSFILKQSALSRIGPAMTVGVAALVVLAGLVLFGESLSPRQGLGIALGLVALVLILA